MPEKPKIVSKVPAITPELLEKNEDEQRGWREKFAVQHVSSATYADLVIKSNLESLDSLDRQIKAAKGDEKASLKERSRQIREDTAIWADSIGRFDLAHELSVDKHLRKLFRARMKAVELPDADWCKHPIFEHVDGHLSQVATREMDFFSVKHGKKVSMIRCRHCGFRNAKDIPAELKKLSDHRAEAVAVAGNLSQHDAGKKLKEHGIHHKTINEILG